ncbi:hypothetical protein RN001_012655 [Aquatica leii]|uniref:rRNA-processing protein EBP2 n=1 Tax=Aquatica leii TaxID=1421715 RepID=A0AAN7P5P0_9COLE|nr:hypothetical protein RN001_012655 [Aquatica leii]
MSDTSDSESLSGSDAELQEAFSKGLLKPGLNVIDDAPKVFVNDTQGLQDKLSEFKLKLPWIEVLDSINKPAPLAPELAAKILEQEEKQENLRKNNKKLPQISVEDDPVLNDFKRETMFYRQAQATVLSSIPKFKELNIPTKRPEDYFAEMAKSDEHMQKIRQNLMRKQVGQERSEKVKQLRAQRKEGKALQIQTKLKRQQEKKQMLDQVKKVRKGVGKDLEFLNNSKQKGKNVPNKKGQENRKWRDQKFGFGGKKRNSKSNTKESSADLGDYGKAGKNRNNMKGSKGKTQRPGKNRRNKIRNRRK